MTDDRDLLSKRFLELSKRSFSSNIYTFTPFLGLSEIDVLKSLSHDLSMPYTLFGGAAGCERVMAKFGSIDEFGYDAEYPIKTLKLIPVYPKYAEKLTHRDILGALMNLGIERDLLGDIVVREDAIYLFTDEKIVPFLLSDFHRAKHTELYVQVVETLPDGDLYSTEKITVPTASERLDLMLAKVYNLSREESNELFRKRVVFIDGKMTENNSQIPKPGSVISVRGFGRFVYRGVTSETKKGKLNLLIEKYV